MSRKILIAGNWKLNKNQAETKAFVNELKEALASSEALKNLEAMVIPSFTSLATAKEAISGSDLQLGAQDISQFASGAYTGEISAEMLKEIGVDAALVGHSERRETFGEDDSVINAKLTATIESGLNSILCCGESEATREAGKTDEWVEGQIESALKGLESLADFDKRIVIAYEPIWAIGTGKTCDSDEANRVISVIRSKLAQITNQSTADKTRILYGGSVKPANIEELIQKSDIDGALVGGASLKKDDFVQIIEKSAAKSKVAC